MGSITKEYLESFEKRYLIGQLPKVFVETGTGKGASVSSVLFLFRSIHTFELDEKLYNNAVQKFKKQAHVLCHYGNSISGLEELVPTINEPVLFWLDAHYSGPGTAFGVEEVPLLRELKVIGKRKNRDIIFIDDAGNFGKEGTWQGDENYAPFAWNWTDINMKAIKKAIGRKPSNILLKPGGDKIVILTNLPITRLILLLISELAKALAGVLRKIMKKLHIKSPSRSIFP